jgi:hypothetical protein
MLDIEGIKRILQVFLYIFMFVFVSPILMRHVCFMRETIESYFLIPLVAFSFIYGLTNFKRIMTQQAEADAN